MQQHWTWRCGSQKSGRVGAQVGDHPLTWVLLMRSCRIPSLLSSESTCEAQVREKSAVGSAGAPPEADLSVRQVVRRMDVNSSARACGCVLGEACRGSSSMRAAACCCWYTSHPQRISYF